MTKVERLECDIQRDLKECNMRASDPTRATVLVEILDVIAAAREEGAEQGLDMAQRWIDSESLQNRHVISLPRDALLAAISFTPPAVVLPTVYGDALPIKETPCSG